MVPYSLDLENRTKSCRLRGSNLCIHSKNTSGAAHAIKGEHILKAAKDLKDVPLQKRHVYHSVIAMVELVGKPRLNSGAGHRVGGPPK